MTTNLFQRKLLYSNTIIFFEIKYNQHSCAQIFRTLTFFLLISFFLTKNDYKKYCGVPSVGNVCEIEKIKMIKFLQLALEEDDIDFIIK